MRATDTPRRPLWRWQRIPASWACLACSAPACGWLTEGGVTRFYCDQHRDLYLGGGYAIVRYDWRSTWHLLTWRWRHPIKAARGRRRSHEQTELLLRLLGETDA